MNKKSSIGVCRSDKIFYAVNTIFLGIVFLFALYPLVYLISSSISSPEAAAQGKIVLFPVGFSLEGYKMVFENKDVSSGFFNSIIYTVVGVAINLFLTLTVAFALSRKELKGRKYLTFFFVFTMWFNGGLIPNYLLVNSLGLIDTRWAIWCTLLINVYNMIITKSYFENAIPNDLYEAASIDGCGYYRYFLQIVLPLSGAIIAVITLFYGIDHWNAYFRPMIYLNSDSLYPLQLVLRKILIANEISASDIMGTSLSLADYGKVELLKYALIIVSCLPLWCAYPLVQKFFVKGVMVGSIKG